MRSLILEYLYEKSKKPYQLFFKRNASWDITVSELIQYPEQSLGFHLAAFLLKYRFELQPKFENHDVFHVLTHTGISVPEEIAMQYLLLGNGKRSVYLFAVIVTGTLLFPDYAKQFVQAYRRGSKAHLFHHLDFSKMLFVPVAEIQSTLLIH